MVHTVLLLLLLQWEVSNRALEVLQSTKDAQGRSIEVCKIRLPPPLFRTYKEAEGLAVRQLHTFDLCRRASRAVKCAVQNP